MYFSFFVLLTGWYNLTCFPVHKFSLDLCLIHHRRFYFVLKIYFLFLRIPFVFLIFCSASTVYFSIIFNFLLAYSKSDNFYNFNLCKSFLQTSTHSGLCFCRFSDFFFLWAHALWNFICRNSFEATLKFFQRRFLFTTAMYPETPSTKDCYKLMFLFGGFDDRNIVFCSPKCLSMGM